MNLKSVGIGAVVAVVIVGGGMLAGTAFAGNEHASNAASSSSISTAAKSSSSATVTSASAESSSSTKADDTASSSSSATKTSSSATAKASSSTKANDSTKSPKKDTPKPVEKPKVDPTPTAAETANKLRVPINWRLSSENKPYPDVNKYPNLWIHVSIAQQRVFLMTGNTVLYTMYTSTGMDRIGAGTPRGTFHIQKERGLSFYNPTAQGGAYNWTSFHNHGEYLFHSVPIYKNGQYILSEAAKLGKQEASHGCIRLSVPDAKWFHDTIKYNTKVVID